MVVRAMVRAMMVWVGSIVLVRVRSLPLMIVVMVMVVRVVVVCVRSPSLSIVVRVLMRSMSVVRGVAVAVRMVVEFVRLHFKLQVQLNVEVWCKAVLGLHAPEWTFPVFFHL